MRASVVTETANGEAAIRPIPTSRGATSSALILISDMPKKKTNPRRRPVTEADLRKAWSAGADFGMAFCLKDFLYVLKAKHDATDADLMQLRDEFEEVVDAYKRGDIKEKDLDGVLADEFNLRVTLK